MGILFIEVVKSHGKDLFVTRKLKLNLKNWRFIRYNSRYDKVQIMDFDCVVYDVYDVSVEELIRASMLRNGTITSEGKAESFLLVCRTCKGSGLSDWVSNIRGGLTKIVYQPEKFMKDREVAYRISHASSQGYYSIARLDLKLKGIEHCKTCKGTGIHTFGGTEDKILKYELVKLKDVV